MAIELICLAVASLILIVQVLGQGVFSNLEHGPGRLAGNRDGLADESVRVKRAKRANQNMLEAMAMFVPAVLAVQLAGQANDLSALGAIVFVGARAAYVPLYWFGAGALRSLAWVVGILGILMILAQMVL